MDEKEHLKKTFNLHVTRIKLHEKRTLSLSFVAGVILIRMVIFV